MAIELSLCYNQHRSIDGAELPLFTRGSEYILTYNNNVLRRDSPRTLAFEQGQRESFQHTADIGKRIADLETRYGPVTFANGPIYNPTTYTYVAKRFATVQGKKVVSGRELTDGEFNQLETEVICALMDRQREEKE